MTISLPQYLVVETSSYCNRRCRTCIRQNDPTKSRFNPDGTAKHEFLSTELVKSAVDQAYDMGFRGYVNLTYFNEPMLDERLPYFAEYAKRKGFETIIATNTDYLTEELARELDGVVSQIHLSIYDRQNFSAKTKKIQALFSKTTLIFDGLHVITHYSPFSHGKSLHNMIQARKHLPCHLTLRQLIINFRGDYMLCCEDLDGVYGLGNMCDLSLKDYWFGEKHLEIVDVLSRPKGRMSYPYCACCPKYDGFTKPRVEVQQ